MLDASKENKSHRSPTRTNLVSSNGKTIPVDRPREKLPAGSTLSRSSMPSKVPFAALCPLSTPDGKKELFAKANYEVYGTIRAICQTMTPVKCFIDTGAGQNLLNRCFLPLTWMGGLRQQLFFNLTRANRQSISFGRNYNDTPKDRRSLYPSMVGIRKQPSSR